MTDRTHSASKSESRGGDDLDRRVALQQLEFQRLMSYRFVIDDLNAARKQAKAERDTWRQAAKAMEIERDQADAERDEARASYANLEREWNATQDALFSMKAERDEARSRLAVEEVRYKKMRDELDDCHLVMDGIKHDWRCPNNVASGPHSKDLSPCLRCEVETLTRDVKQMRDERDHAQLSESHWQEKYNESADGQQAFDRLVKMLPEYRDLYDCRVSQYPLDHPGTCPVCDSDEHGKSACPRVTALREGDE